MNPINPELEKLKEEYAKIFEQHALYYSFHGKHQGSQVEEVQEFMEKSFSLGSKSALEMAIKKVDETISGMAEGHVSDRLTAKRLAISTLNQLLQQYEQK